MPDLLAFKTAPELGAVLLWVADLRWSVGIFYIASGTSADLFCVALPHRHTANSRNLSAWACWFSLTFFPTITFTLPVSTSSVKKTTPVAVGGCGRAVTTRESTPGRPLGRCCIREIASSFILIAYYLA